MNIFFILASILFIPFGIFFVAGLAMTVKFIIEYAPGAILDWWKEIKKKASEKSFDGFMDTLFPVAFAMLMLAMVMMLCGVMLDAHRTEQQLRNNTTNVEAR